MNNKILDFLEKSGIWTFCHVRIELYYVSQKKMQNRPAKKEIDGIDKGF